jgi:hypothetical protein
VATAHAEGKINGTRKGRSERKKKVLLSQQRIHIDRQIMKLQLREPRACRESDTGCREWSASGITPYLNECECIKRERETDNSAAESSHLHHNADGVYRSISVQLRFACVFIALHLSLMQQLAVSNSGARFQTYKFDTHICKLPSNKQISFATVGI